MKMMLWLRVTVLGRLRNTALDSALFRFGEFKRGQKHPEAIKERIYRGRVGDQSGIKH